MNMYVYGMTFKCHTKKKGSKSGKKAKLKEKKRKDCSGKSGKGFHFPNAKYGGNVLNLATYCGYVNNIYLININVKYY